MLWKWNLCYVCIITYIQYGYIIWEVSRQLYVSKPWPLPITQEFLDHRIQLSCVYWETEIIRFVNTKLCLITSIAQRKTAVIFYESSFSIFLFTQLVQFSPLCRNRLIQTFSNRSYSRNRNEKIAFSVSEDRNRLNIKLFLARWFNDNEELLRCFISLHKRQECWKGGDERGKRFTSKRVQRFDGRAEIRVHTIMETHSTINKSYGKC